MPNTSLKKTTKKWVYIGVGLAAFILIVAGVGFYFWNKSKKSNESDSTDEEWIAPEEIPPEIKIHRQRDWTDLTTGLSKYRIPADKLPANLSVSQAKDELLEALWQWYGKDEVWDKKKIAKTLEKNAPRINLADKKGNEDDPLFETKFLESIVKKYQPKNIFSNLPQQTKFHESIREIKSNIHFLRVGFDLKYKGNKKIDWVASLQAEIKSGNKNRTKTQQEEDFAKMTNYLRREHMPFIRIHINQFPSLTSLKELNNWVHTLIKKEVVANRIAYSRFYLGQEMKKKVLSPAREGIKLPSFPNLKNEKFGLTPSALAFNLKE